MDKKNPFTYVKCFFGILLRLIFASVLAYASCLLFAQLCSFRTTGTFAMDFLKVIVSAENAPAEWQRWVFVGLWYLAFVFQVYMFSVSSSSKGTCYDYLSLTAGKPYSLLRDARLFLKDEAICALLASLFWSAFSLLFDGVPFAFLLRTFFVFSVYTVFYFVSRVLWSRARTGGMDGDPSTPQ